LPSAAAELLGILKKVAKKCRPEGSAGTITAAEVVNLELMIYSF
jgi:hypothetical protein